jgi:hypothetical protein
MVDDVIPKYFWCSFNAAEVMMSLYKIHLKNLPSEASLIKFSYQFSQLAISFFHTLFFFALEQNVMERNFY